MNIFAKVFYFYIMRAKVFIILVLTLLATNGYSSMNSEEDPILVPLTTNMVNKQKQTSNNPKSQELSLWLLDHSLFFYDVDDNYTMFIYDDDGVLVFSDSVSPITIQIDLPLSFTGEYHLFLETDELYYEGILQL